MRGHRKKFRVFISHYANADKEIAAKLKEWIETQYQSKVKVFASSSEHNGVTINSIKSGTFATSEIDTNLATHDVLITLLTPTSIKRPWVIFESGAGFGRGKTFIPILCKGLTRESIDKNNPLRELEVRSASAPSNFNTILQELDAALGLKHTSVGAEELRAALCKPDSSSIKTNAASEPNGKHVTGHFPGGGILAPKAEPSGVRPDLENDPHIAFAKSHSA